MKAIGKKQKNNSLLFHPAWVYPKSFYRLLALSGFLVLVMAVVVFLALSLPIKDYAKVSAVFSLSSDSNQIGLVSFVFQGTKYTDISIGHDYFSFWKAGQTVSVFVNPNNPAHVETLSNAILIGAIMLFCVLSELFSCFVLVLLKKQALKNKDLMGNLEYKRNAKVVSFSQKKKGGSFYLTVEYEGKQYVSPKIVSSSSAVVSEMLTEEENYADLYLGSNGAYYIDWEKLEQTLRTKYNRQEIINTAGK
jgi:hypothetical protein